MSILDEFHHFFGAVARPLDAAKEVAAFSLAPRSTIEQAKDDTEVVIAGRVECIDTLIAPFSERPCAAYHVRVEKKIGTSRFWREVFDESESCSFFVADESGSRALVEGASVSPYFAFDASGHTGPFLKNERTRAFLLERGIKFDGFIFDKTLRVLEGVVEEGESVDVLGLAQWEADPEGTWATDGYRGRSGSERLRLVGKNGGSVRVRDAASWKSPGWPPSTGDATKNQLSSDGFDAAAHEAKVREELKRDAFGSESPSDELNEHLEQFVQTRLMQDLMEAAMDGDETRARALAAHLHTEHGHEFSGIIETMLNLK